MTTIDSMLELAIDLRDDGELRGSINILQKILDDYTVSSELHEIYGVLGEIHLGLGENHAALRNYKKAVELDPTWELASFGVYVTLKELRRSEEAIHELIRYLKIYPANLYKKTLEGLLDGLKTGYMTDYEEEIRYLAKANGFDLP